MNASLADLIGQFVRRVDSFLLADCAENATVLSAAPGREIDTAHERRMDRRDAMRDTGRQLARELVAAGRDAKAVLRLLHCIGVGGGGAQAVRQLWPQVKASLQQLAIQLEIGDKEDGKLLEGEQAEGGKAPGKRGRKQRFDPLKDQEIAEAWQRARDKHIAKKQFVKDCNPKLTLAELDRLLTRARQRRNRARTKPVKPIN